MTNENKLLVICLMGPTAIGKSDLALRLANQLPLGIVSVDSAMVYRGLDIGTAKPNATLLKKIPHRLINVCDPSHSYSAGQFYKEAIREIESIHAINQIPLLVGGTMLYFHVLQRGFSDLPSANPAVRKKIQQEANCKGWPFLYEKLKILDPKSAKKINSKDVQRIQRALEVYETTGKPLSDYQRLNRFEPLPYKFVNIIILPKSRDYLHQCIEKRFDEMLKNNFLAEVRHLYKRRDLSLDSPAIRTVGYRQMWEYLDGEYDWDTMRYKAIVATRQLAKRQLTWLKGWSNADRFIINKDENLESLACMLINHVMREFKSTR